MAVRSGEDDGFADGATSIFGATLGFGEAGATLGEGGFGCGVNGANLRTAKLGGEILEEVLGKRFGWGSTKAGAERDLDGFAADSVGVTRVSGDGIAEAERRVNGSTRRKGSGLEMDGAATASGCDCATVGRTREKLGRGGAMLGTEITGAAKAGSSNGRWKGVGACMACLASR
jgi:hypothetical protein